MNEISPRDATAILQQPGKAVLLDVRELAELESGFVADARHIPMGEIPRRLNELDRDRIVICMCHLGGRSAHVAAFLRTQGFKDVRNLTGGIEAWAQDVGIDRTAPT